MNRESEIANVMDKVALYGSWTIYLKVVSNGYCTPSDSWVERELVNRADDSEDLRRELVRLNKLQGICDCMELGLVQNEAEFLAVFREYGLLSANEEISRGFSD